MSLENLKAKNIIIMVVLALMFGFLTVFYPKIRMEYSDPASYQLRMDSHIYDLSSPKLRWDLPDELQEISGLSYFHENQLACVQDEKGVFYVFDLGKNEIVRRDEFGEPGDYEGVEVINDSAYVLKSNGDLYFFDIRQRGIGEVKKIKTDLSKHNDSEGLAFHSLNQEILIACKEDPGTKEVEIEKSRSIYGIDLEKKKFHKKPIYLIEGKSYNEMIEKKELRKKDHRPFKPSAIAVHPKNNFVFVIGTVGKMMVILNPDGDIVDLIPLNPRLFVQPEGICFSPSGDLYISSEGKGGKGYILKF